MKTFDINLRPTAKTQTGRTQRMLNAAIDAARAEPSKKFVALFPTPYHADWAKRHRTFKAPSNLVFIGASADHVAGIDFASNQVILHLAGQDHVVDAFIDHDVCEQQAYVHGAFTDEYKRASKAAQRWDAKPGEYGYKP